MSSKVRRTLGCRRFCPVDLYTLSGLVQTSAHFWQIIASQLHFIFIHSHTFLRNRQDRRCRKNSSTISTSTTIYHHQYPPIAVNANSGRRKNSYIWGCKVWWIFHRRSVTLSFTLSHSFLDLIFYLSAFRVLKLAWMLFLPYYFFIIIISLCLLFLYFFYFLFFLFTFIIIIIFYYYY